MTIFFPDLSEYDSVSVEPGTVAVIARATLSTSIADCAYQRFQAQAAAAGALFVGYHWLNHGNLSAQASWCRQHAGDVPLMIDAEDVAGNTGYNGPLTVADITGFAAEYRRLGGTVALVYLPRWYWADHMGSPDLTPLTAAGLALVASDYTTYADDGPGWASYGGVTPAIWQYTDALPYGGGSADFNAFRGTVDELRALVGGADMTPEQAQQLAETHAVVMDGNWFGDDPQHPGQPRAYLPAAAHWIVDTVGGVTAQVAGLVAGVGALQAALQTVLAQGASIDTAAVLAAVNAVRDDTASLHAENATLQAKVTELEQRLAASAQAAATTLNPPAS